MAADQSDHSLKLQSSPSCGQREKTRSTNWLFWSVSTRFCEKSPGVYLRCPVIGRASLGFSNNCSCGSHPAQLGLLQIWCQSSSSFQTCYQNCYQKSPLQAGTAMKVKESHPKSQAHHTAESFERCLCCDLAAAARAVHGSSEKELIL